MPVILIYELQLFLIMAFIAMSCFNARVKSIVNKKIKTFSKIEVNKKIANISLTERILINMLCIVVHVHSYNFILSALLICHFTDTLPGVSIGGKTLFQIEGCYSQSFKWDKYGLRISVPPNTLSPRERIEISVSALVGGQYALPENTELISIVYCISLSKPLLKPVKLEIQHCANIVTEDHSNFLSFATASIDQHVLPYQFQLEEGGKFLPGDQYGSIYLSQFSLKAIIKSIIRPMLWFLGYDNTSSEEADNQPTTGNQSNSESQEMIGSSDNDDEIVFEDAPTTQDVLESQNIISAKSKLYYILSLLYSLTNN